MALLRITRIVMAALVGSILALTSPSCGDVLIQSTKIGLLEFVSGTVYTTLGQNSINPYLNNLFLGGYSGLLGT